MTRDTDVHTELNCEIKHETDAAMQICTSEGELLWIPFSQIEHVERGRGDMSASVTMTKWIAQKKGLL